MKDNLYSDWFVKKITELIKRDYEELQKKRGESHGKGMAEKNK